MSSNKKGTHKLQKSDVINIDLPKKAIQVCLISKNGELVSNKAMPTQKLKELPAETSIAIEAMEGCSACQYWGSLVGANNRPLYALITSINHFVFLPILLEIR